MISYPEFYVFKDNTVLIHRIVVYENQNKDPVWATAINTLNKINNNTVMELRKFRLTTTLSTTNGPSMVCHSINLCQNFFLFDKRQDRLYFARYGNNAYVLFSLFTECEMLEHYYTEETLAAFVIKKHLHILESPKMKVWK